MNKYRSWALMPSLMNSSNTMPQGLGGYARPFYGFGNRQHRPHRKTAAQRYHRAGGKR
jgi:hypothetical protein